MPADEKILLPPPAGVFYDNFPNVIVHRLGFARLFFAHRAGLFCVLTGSARGMDINRSRRFSSFSRDSSTISKDGPQFCYTD